MTSLSGCVPGLSDEQITVIRTQCPPLVHYTHAEQLKLLRELKKLPPGSITPDILNDYGKMRDICRKITSKVPPRHRHKKAYTQPDRFNDWRHWSEH